VTGGGVSGLVFLFGFLCRFFLPFSTFPEPSDTALPGASVVVLVRVPEPVEPFLFFVGFVDVLVGFGFDFFVVDVEVLVEVEVEVEVVGGGWTVVVTVTAGVVAVTGGHVWETLTIGSWTGSGSVLGSVPGATFWNVNCWPPTTVMITVQPSADALGIAPRPNTANTQPAVSAAIDNLRLLNTVAYSSRGAPRVNSSQLRSQVGLG